MWLAGSLGKYKRKQQQTMSGDFHSECSKAAGFELRPGREPQSTLALVEKEESSFHYLKRPFFLRTQAQVPQGWPAFPLTRNIMGNGS